MTRFQSVSLLAALLSVAGAISLLLKGGTLLWAGSSLGAWVWLAVGVGLVVGGFKARFIMLPFCRRNRARLEALVRPRWWQCYSPGFFVALVIMIAAGATISRLVAAYPVGLVAVGGFDLALGVALGASGLLCWATSSAKSHGA